MAGRAGPCRTVGQQAKLAWPRKPEQRAPLRLLRRLARSKQWSSTIIRRVAQEACHRKVLAYANREAIYPASAIGEWVRLAVVELRLWERLGGSSGSWNAGARASRAVAPPKGVNGHWWDSVFYYSAMALWAVHHRAHGASIDYAVVDFLDGLGLHEDWPHRHHVERVLGSYFPKGTLSAHAAQ